MTTVPSVSLLLILFFQCSVQGQEVRDDLGRMIPCSPRPQRIISLAPSITETLFALGLDSAIVGVTDYCNYPAAAATKTRVGGINNPNLEQIAALRPDLIVLSTSGNMKPDFDKLVSLGMRVFVSDPRSTDGVFRSILDLGTLCDRSAEARELARRLRSEREQLVASAAHRSKKSVVLLLSLKPIIAVGKGTFMDELLALANARNLTRDAPTAYPLLGREEILRLQPDVIVVTRDVARTTGEIVAQYPEWNSLNAVKAKHLSIVDADVISRPGPRIILGLQQIIEAIHGE